MGYLLGTDEAGYGPNLGPLVISATVWEVPDGIGNDDLYERLAEVVSPKPEKDGSRVAMADSKSLYAPGKGLRNLELGLWAALGATASLPSSEITAASPCTAGQASSGTRDFSESYFQRIVLPRSWRDLWDDLDPGTLNRVQSVPWYADYDEPLPIDCPADQCSVASETLRRGLADAGVKLLSVRSRAVFEGQFNDLIYRHGSKGTVLSLQTLALAGEIIESLPAGPIAMVCDKHGGRNRYGPLLSKQFPDHLIEVREEGRASSRYRFGPSERRVEVCVRTKAESCLPAALASMASKYLRELAMRAFNVFWRRHLPELKPTAGYPLDAKRFRADIAEQQRRLHIDDYILWRCV
ncbi:MAG: hypothetical protein JW959_04205 [Pirellulales bacterium]|nr:hypothetical protein [Pirellulales bacterium]